jgi:predicted GIY-YIG superfamily endonuclease
MPLYLIHMERKLAHSQHYLGFCNDVKGIPSRINYHRKGYGSRFLKAANEVGIAFKVVRTWEIGSRDDERRLKKQKNAPRLCPVCNPALKREIDRAAVELDEAAGLRDDAAPY